MKHLICSSIIMLLTAAAANAQLVVSDDYNVGIATEADSFNPMLMVGEHSFFGSSGLNVGIAGKPEAKNMGNIGVLGTASAGSYYSFQKNCGVIGMTTGMSNSSHGRNYGLTGMINPVSGTYGGAGIFASSSDYYYSSPCNIQGTYAAYFDGSVAVNGNFTTAGIYTSCDSRLYENVYGLSENQKCGGTTLGNVLNMDVVEYGVKSQLPQELPDEISCENIVELTRQLEFLKAEEERLTSRRHYGVDAQELQKTYPGLVLEGQDGTLSVNYLEMVPLLVRSLQELKQEMDGMKDEE